MSSTISIRDLAVTQDGFRNPRQIDDMIVFVSEGGVFHNAALAVHSEGGDTRPINIVTFEDGRMFIHDGHHRVASIYLSGRKTLDKSEYRLTNWKYSDYTDINFKLGWVTPFDPRTHVRTCDYAAFKRNVEYCLKGAGETGATEYIRKRLETYTRPRRVLTIRDLIMRSL